MEEADVEDCQKFNQRGLAILDENLGPVTVIRPYGRYFTRAGGVRPKLALAPASFTARRRRSTGLSITARFEVSTYPPSGHHRKCPLRTSSSLTHTSSRRH